MPRMMPLNIDRPDLSNILSRSEAIKSQRLNNAINTRNFEREPERYEMEQARGKQALETGKQNLATGKHNLKTGSARYNLEKLQTAGRLFESVTNQQEYEAAVSTFVKTFPDEIGSLKTVPKEYDPKLVEQIVAISKSAAERVSAMNLEGRKITAAASETSAQKQARDLGTYEGKKKLDIQYPDETPESQVKSRQANLYLQWADGRPIDTFSEQEKKIVEQQIAGDDPTTKKETMKERNYREWKVDNPNKSLMDFEAELKKLPTTAITIEGRSQLARKTYEDKISNQAGFMAQEARKTVDSKIKSDMKLKTDIATGKESADNLAVEVMKPHIIKKYPDAFLFETKEGAMHWVLGDGTDIADKNGWVE